MALAANLPQHIRDYIHRQIAEGRYDNEESVIVGVLEHAIQEEYWQDDSELEAAIAEADRGDVLEVTPALKADIRRQSEENRRLGHRVRDDISY